MIDLGLQTDLNRLHSAIDHSRDAAEPFRRNRKRMMKEFVGSHYNDNGASHEVLVNLLAMTADVYTIGLAAGSPCVSITTPHRELWPFAYQWQQAINSFVKEIRFAETHQQIVLDAFFSFGIAKIYQAEWEPIQFDEDIWADPGRPYIGRISPDDFGMDMTVKEIRRCRFMWDEYRVSWEAVQTSEDFDRSVINEMNPTSKWERSDEQVHDITSGSVTDDDDYEPMVDLMDVYLPELHKVAVFPRHGKGRPLKVLDVGPEGGPFEMLTFADVPDNVMPSSPAQNLMPLHLLYNGLMRKQSRQAKRQKTNPVYRPAGAEDAKRMQRHGDGEWIKVNNPNDVSVVNQGGVDQGNLAFSMGVYDLFDRAAGNLTAMAGLGAQTGTVGQEELIHSAVSRKEAKMQDRDQSFVAKCMSRLGHLMWADKFLNIPMSEEVEPHTGVYADTSWTPEQREGDFFQYNFDVEPYSMHYEPPYAKTQRMERLIAAFQNLYPLIQEAGGTLDVQELFKQYGELLRFPQADQLITFNAPTSVERPGPQGVNQGMPAETTRNYVRHNVPTGGTQESRSNVLQQALMNNAPNQDQMASMMRPPA